MEKEIKIDSLKISIGKKEVELSVEEAKKLKKALEDIFGKEVVHEHHHDWWYRPYISTVPYPYSWGTVYCGTTIDQINCTATVANASNITPTGTSQLCMTIN